MKLRTQKDEVMPNLPDLEDKDLKRYLQDLSDKVKGVHRNTRGDLDKVLGEFYTGPYGEKLIVISNNTTDASHDLDFSEGWVFDEDTRSILINPASTVSGLFTKCFDNPAGDNKWSAGSGGNGLFDNAGSARSLAADTWYDVYAIGGAAVSDDVGALPAGAPMTDLPTGYTWYCRIGTWGTDGSANLLPIIQRGNYFLHTDGVTSKVSETSIGTAQVSRNGKWPSHLPVVGIVNISGQFTSTAEGVNIGGSNATLPVGSVYSSQLIGQSSRNSTIALVESDDGTWTYRHNGPTGTYFIHGTLGWIDTGLRGM